MEPPQERLPDRRDTILATGAHLMVTLKERNGTAEIEIQGNQPGLQALAAICAGLAELTSGNSLLRQTTTTWTRPSGALRRDRLL